MSPRDAIDAARARLAATIANEVTQNGGLPVSEDNPHYQAALKAVNDAVEESNAAFDPWKDAGVEIRIRKVSKED